MQGHLSVFMGPMGAGKTTKAIEQATQMTALGFKVLYINSSLDTRILEGGVDGVFTSHNSSIKYLSDKVATVSCSSLALVNYDGYKVIIIDEAQFFDDLVVVVSKLVTDRKTVHVYSLTGDFNKERIGHAIDLIPQADVFVQLKAKCVDCITTGNIVDAAFTYRTKQCDNTVTVGAFELYLPLCGKCYIERATK